MQKIKNSKIVLKKKKTVQSKGLILPQIKTNYKVIVIKTGAYFN